MYTYCTCILSVLTVRASELYCTYRRMRGSVSSASLTNRPEREGEGERDSDVEVEVDFRAAMSSPEGQGFSYPDCRGFRGKEVEESRDGE